MTEKQLNNLAQDVAAQAEAQGLDLIGIVLIDRTGAAAFLERDPVETVVDTLRRTTHHLEHGPQPYPDYLNWTPNQERSPQSCPECVAGKHTVCAGFAFDDTDTETDCPCAAQGHAAIQETS